MPPNEWVYFIFRIIISQNVYTMTTKSYFWASDCAAACHSPKKKAVKTQSNGGLVYPLDIWFLIGQFVNPEDVGRFAAICRSSNYVTQKARFWQHIYKR